MQKVNLDNKSLLPFESLTIFICTKKKKTIFARLANQELFLLSLSIRKKNLWLYPCVLVDQHSVQMYSTFCFILKVYFFIVTIVFKPITSVHNSCSYHQVKTLIDFWCRRDLNLGPLLDNKRLYQLS